jgi:hypothetical protein
VTSSIWQAGTAALILSLTAGVARAQSISDLHGIADLTLSAADGEKGWLDGGFGKTGASGGQTRLGLTQAALEWKPKISFNLGAVVTAQYQAKADPSVDLGEAYLQFKAPPNPVARVSARAGIFYPPVSLEHDGTAWTTPDMLSASALNSWIGEEVKVTGLEATVTRDFGGHEVSATGAVFGWDDTAGTLLTFRGWALHGVRGGLSSAFQLPPLSPFMRNIQDDETYVRRELDHRAGYYGALKWSPPAPVSLQALYYDNAGDRTSVDNNLQWAWETRFLDLGLRWDVDDKTKVLAQALSGETLMGYRYGGSRWVDMGYHAAYVLAARKLGEDAVSGRLDWFETNDRTLQAIDDNDETGWAATLAWRHRLAGHADLLIEAQHVQSDRPSRMLGGLAPRQNQTLLQSALRLSF